MILRLSQSDLAGLLSRIVPHDAPVTGLAIGIGADGLALTGSYPMLVAIPFETVWKLSASGGKLQAQLAGFRAMGLSAGLFKSKVLAAIHGPGVTVAGDVVTVDLPISVDAVTTMPGTVEILARVK